MNSLLVTGGAGFIGSNLVHYWLRRHPDDHIVVLDALTYAGNLSSLGPALASGRVRFVHGDIRTPGMAEALLRDHGATTVVHLAAESHVDRSILGPDAFLETNVAGTHVLLKAARQVWLEEGGAAGEVRFHHVSTDEVYGSLRGEDRPFTEESRYDPSSPYAASKAASDHLVRAYFRTYGLPISITNSSNTYGPFQFPEKLIPLMLVLALDGRPLPVYGDGLHVRDWLFVEDHCRALECVLQEGRLGETYNVGGNSGTTNLKVLRLLCRTIDEAFRENPVLARGFPRCPAAHGQETAGLIEHTSDRPGHDRRYEMDGGKIERELGFTPSESLESGIQRTVGWYLANESWWRAVMDGSYRQWMLLNYGGRG